ncbi:MAG: radical SAM protein, partial [Candidatus Brocadiia bacterium]
TEELIEMGTGSFLFTAMGEPFIHPDALDLMAACKAAGRECTVNTNGLLLTREALDELLEMRFDQLRITTMAGTPELYEQIHPGTPGAAFERLVDNLRYLAERKKALGLSKPEVWIITVAIAPNHDAMLEVARLAAKVGAERVWYRAFDDVDDPCLAPLAPSSEQAAVIRRQAREAARCLEARGLRHNVPEFLCTFGGQIDTAALYATIPCYYPWFVLRVETDGSVYACCRCYKPLGNVNEQTIREIWHGPAFREFRRKAGNLNRTGESPEACVCDRCVHAQANIRVYRKLHPWRGRSAALQQLQPMLGAGEDEFS